MKIFPAKAACAGRGWTYRRARRYRRTGRRECAPPRNPASRCALCSEDASLRRAPRCPGRSSASPANRSLPAILTMHPPKLGETYSYAAVLFAFTLELADAHRPDLAGRAHMRSPARLQVDFAVLADADEPHLSCSHRRLDRHRSHDLRFCNEVLIADEACQHRMILPDQPVDLLAQYGPVDRAWIWNIEIQSPAIV